MPTSPRLLLHGLAILVLASCGGSDDPADDGSADQPDADADVDDAPRCPVDVAPRAGTVLTDAGAATGVLDGSLWSWKGIPYAAPPVGDLRWRPPAPATCWSGELAATTFGPMCPQIAAGDSSGGEVVGDEDCLTLNIWAPDGATAAPVLFYMHGGGDTTGSASDALYDGADLAARTGDVVVTIEYRLGALGFLSHAGLNAESADGVSGNYGILDQAAALAWVKANVAGFGGDPSRVLLFGESAGAQNTLVHVVSPRSAGLFSAALAESGGIYRTTLAEGIEAMAAVVDGVGCGGATDEVACMRGKSFEELAAFPSAPGPLTPGLQYGPVIDGVIVPDEGLAIIARGEHNHVPLVIGSNAQETSRMIADVTTEAEYIAAVRAQYGLAIANILLPLYPVADFASPRAALTAVTTDATWTCPSRRIARAVATSQDEPVYRYLFSWRSPGAVGAKLGAFHGLDVPFVFHAFDAISGGFTPDAGDLALSDAMQDYWSRFATAGDPNGDGALAWPEYDEAGDAYLQLDDSLTTGDGIATARCDAIDAAVAGADD